MPINKIHQKGAISIILALIILSATLVISLGVAGLMIAQSKMAIQASKSIKAFYAADAGAEWCLYQLRKGEDCLLPPGAPLDNGATWEVAVQDGVKSWTIQSTGRYGDTSRRIEVVQEK